MHDHSRQLKRHMALQGVYLSAFVGLGIANIYFLTPAQSLAIYCVMGVLVFGLYRSHLAMRKACLHIQRFASEQMMSDQVASDHVMSEQEETSAAPQHRALHKRILIAEDNKINQLIITQMLELLGCKVDIAAHGKEAVEKVKQGEYHLVLMDCMMPEMDGYEATQAIRALKSKAADVPIIALTANTQAYDSQKCLDSGMNDYLAKPLQKSELQTMLTKWLPNITVEETPATLTFSTTAHPTALATEMDYHAWDMFLQIVGSNAAAILHKHCAIAEGYVHTIGMAIEQKNFKAMADAAHPLKSASQQIGVLEVAKLAANIEKIGRSDAPDAAILLDLMHQLRHSQKAVENAVHHHFEIKKTA